MNIRNLYQTNPRVVTFNIVKFHSTISLKDLWQMTSLYRKLKEFKEWVSPDPRRPRIFDIRSSFIANSLDLSNLIYKYDYRGYSGKMRNCITVSTLGNYSDYTDGIEIRHLFQK